jgi:hypothetical protein
MAFSKGNQTMTFLKPSTDDPETIGSQAQGLLYRYGFPVFREWECLNLAACRTEALSAEKSSDRCIFRLFFGQYARY